MIHVKVGIDNPANVFRLEALAVECRDQQLRLMRHTGVHHHVVSAIGDERRRRASPIPC
jgi:hypothetical protein